jgi:hypothetical protein
MTYRYRKSKNIGPFRASVSKKGARTSFGFLGFRFRVSPCGRKYWNFGILGTGLYHEENY